MKDFLKMLVDREVFPDLKLEKGKTYEVFCNSRSNYDERI